MLMPAVPEDLRVQTVRHSLLGPREVPGARLQVTSMVLLTAVPPMGSILVKVLCSLRMVISLLYQEVCIRIG